jgi:hypothetical protein
MPEHSDAILADAPPGVPRAGECGAPSLGRPADLVSGDPPRPRPRRAWPPAEPCDGRRGSATAPRFLEEHASVLELRYLRLRHLPICSPFSFVGHPSILLRIGCPPNSSLPREEDSGGFWWVWAGTVVGVPGAGSAEHRQDWADTHANSSWGRSGGGVARGRAVVGLGERARRDREREPRDAAARVGLGSVLRGRIAGGSVRVREVRVSTRQ